MSDAQRYPEPGSEDDHAERQVTPSETPQLGSGTGEIAAHRATGAPSDTDTEGGAGASRGPLVGCTIACRDQLPAARALRESFLRHHPAARFVVLVVERPDLTDRSELDAMTVADLGIGATEFAHLAVAHDASSLRALLLPRLLHHLVTQGVTAMFFEPAVRVFQPFDDLLGDTTMPLILVPRVLRPLAADGSRPDRADLAAAGTFDPNAFVVRPGAADVLVDWAQQAWADPDAGSAPLHGAAASIKHEVIRDPGVGLSVWNAAQRELTLDTAGQYVVDGAPLRSVHFEGFEPGRPWLLSAHYADRPRVLLSENPILAELCANYRTALVAAGHAQARAHPYDHVPGGLPLPDELRREYLAEWREHAVAPPSPFAPAGETTDESTADGAVKRSSSDPVAAFLRWASTPSDESQQRSGGSRWTAAVWADDPQLRAEHPDPFGVDAATFHEWCLSTGVPSGRVPSTVLHTPAGQQQVALVDQLGLSVIGSGTVAEALRAAARSSGLPTSDTLCYPVVLRCAPDSPVPSDRYTVEVDPEPGRSPGDAAELWYLTDAARAATWRAEGPTTRTVRLPTPQCDPVDLPTRKGQRAGHGLSAEFVIFAAVDHAHEHVDNALGVVSAFLTAFHERADVRLLLRVTGARAHPEAAERLRLATAADPRVLLREVAPRAENDPTETDVTADTHTADDPLAAADCALALPRGDGQRHAPWLLSVAARGIPVIAVEHPGIVELLGPSGGRFVACTASGEPDSDSAVHALRTAAADVTQLAEMGRAVREHLVTARTASEAGEHLRECVEQAYRHWRTRSARDAAVNADPLRPLVVARHALHRAPDVAVGARGTMTPALRRAVLKAVSHYDEHLRDVLRSVVDAVEQSAEELLRRQEAVSEPTQDEGLRADLDRISQRQDQLAAQLLNADDAVVRARTELTEHHHQLAELERGGDTANQVNTLAQRMDGLTGAVERVLDRVDALEQRQSAEQDWQSAVRAASQDATSALQRTEVLQRALAQEHERNNPDNAGTTTVVCDAGLLRLPERDECLLPWLMTYSTWDAEVSGLLDHLLDAELAEAGGDSVTFVDIGAYVGYQSVRALHRLGGSGAVVAVEPCPASRALLRHNVEVNAPVGSGWLTVVEGAAWDSSAELIGWPGQAGGVDLQPETAEPGFESPERVRGTRLDDEWQRWFGDGSRRLSVVHVDAAAQVHRALVGMRGLLLRDRPSVVCAFAPGAIARTGGDPAELLHTIAEWGYDIVPVGRDTAVTAHDLLAAIDSSGVHTVKLWLRPR